MKKWKIHEFSSSGNGAPTGIALTVLAYNSFSPVCAINALDSSRSYDDFTALHNLVKSIRNQFCLTIKDSTYYYSISETLPVEPYNNLFEKMTLNQQTTFHDKIVAMDDKLDEVKNKESLSNKCTLLTELFGTDFPILSNRSVVGSSESA